MNLVALGGDEGVRQLRLVQLLKERLGPASVLLLAVLLIGCLPAEMPVERDHGEVLLGAGHQDRLRPEQRVHEQIAELLLEDVAGLVAVLLEIKGTPVAQHPQLVVHSRRNRSHFLPRTHYLTHPRHVEDKAVHPHWALR